MSQLNYIPCKAIHLDHTNVSTEVGHYIDVGHIHTFVNKCT